MNPMPTVGVLGLQGGVREHARLLGALGAEVAVIRRPGDLVGPDGVRVDALVLPGGESSVIDRLVRRLGLQEPLRNAIRDGLPALGTCAGLIELSARVLNPAPGQRSLGVLDVTVDRNAFGPQIASRVTTVATAWGPIRAALIRAPRIAAVGPRAEAVARDEDIVLGARQGTVIGVSFHPEITGDPTLHRALLELAG